MEAGEIEFRARDENGELVFEIESWVHSSNPVFDFLYDRLGIARELQLNMWAFFLERVAQVSGDPQSPSRSTPNAVTITPSRGPAGP